MNRAERRALGVPKTVASNIEEAEKRRTVNTYSVAVASVLIMLREEAGIEIKYC